MPDFKKLANDMTGDRNGLTTTAWLMQKFEVIKHEDKKAVPNSIVVVEALKTKANNRLQELASETVDQNNYAIKERLSRLAQENPSLYGSFTGEVNSLENTTNELKTKREKLLTQYKEIAAEVATIGNSNPTPEVITNIKNKINDFITQSITQRQAQIDLEQKQAKLFDYIFISAGQAGIALPKEKKGISHSQ